MSVTHPDMTHARGCPRTGVTKSKVLPGRGYCPSCKRIVAEVPTHEQLQLVEAGEAA